MSANAGSARSAAIVLAVLSVPVFFWGLGGYSAVNGDEAFYQTAAREMARTGEWWRITANGELRIYDVFMNAPIHYWARALLVALFGDNGWTMRAIAATFGAATVLATHRLALAVAGPRAAFLAAFALLTTFQFVYVHGARTGELDSIVAFVFVASALLFRRALVEERSFLPHHVCVLSLLVLKLPVIAMPIGAELAILLAGHRRRLGEWIRLFVWIAPAFLVWHVGQAILHGQAVLDVGGTMLGEAAGSTSGEGGLASNALFYGATVLAAAYPWSLAYAPAALALGIRRRSLGEGTSIVAAYAAAVVLFYLLVDKHYSWYLIPALPFLSVLVGTWLDRLVAGDVGPADLCLAVLVLAAAAAFRTDWIGVNPFERDDLDRWLESPHWSSASGTLLGAGLGAGVVLAWLARDAGSRAGRPVAAVVVATCALLGALRVAAPLTMTGTRSAIEALRDRLADRKAAEGIVADPIPVPSRFVRLGWYYFGDEYHVVQCAGTPTRFFVLVDRALAGRPEDRVRCAELDPYASIRSR